MIHTKLIIMILIIMNLAVFFSGCSPFTYPEDMRKAEEVCKYFGGLKYYEWFMGRDTAYCKDGNAVTFGLKE